MQHFGKFASFREISKQIEQHAPMRKMFCSLAPSYSYNLLYSCKYGRVDYCLQGGLIRNAIKEQNYKIILTFITIENTLKHLALAQVTDKDDPIIFREMIT